jgi:class 3 adenylate cyclase
VVRAGVASGDALLRHGDVFGPVVNLAARAVKAASPSDVVAPVSVAANAGIKAQRLGPHQLRGIEKDIERYRLIAQEVPSR